MNTDEGVQSILREGIATESPWLLDSFDRVLRVNASRPKSPYSFEWLVQTALATHLLRQTNVPISSVRVGLKEVKSTKKPDIAFRIGEASVALQIKTVPSFNAHAYQMGDMVKKLNATHIYLLVVSYPHPNASSATSDTLCTLTGPCGFLWRLRKIK